MIWKRALLGFCMVAAILSTVVAAPPNDAEFREALRQFVEIAQAWLDQTPPPIEKPTIDNFTVSPAEVEEGEAATLSWATSGAATVEITPAFGQVEASGALSVSPANTTEYRLVATNSAGAVEATVKVTVTIPTPPPPPPTGVVTHGIIPEDGYLSDSIGIYRLRPDVVSGERLSGTTLIAVKNQRTSDPIPVRLLVDGLPQASFTIDTTQWDDGTHVLGVQIYPNLPPDTSAMNGSDVVVFNNSGQPFTDLKQQAVCMRCYRGHEHLNSLVWARVDVDLTPRPYPRDPQLDKHPRAASEADRQRLVTEKVWWVEGMCGPPTPLFRPMPILAKNEHGDYFIAQYNPEAPETSNVDYVGPYVEACPAYDGPRGVCSLSPYASIVHDRFHRFPDGQLGWIGVDKGGRVFRLDIHGNVTTILGPRSVEDVVGTDPGLYKRVTLDDRLDNGEKEYVGSHVWKDGTRGRLNTSTDIWVCELFPFEGIIADRGNNRVREIYFGTGGPDKFPPGPHLMRAWPIEKVSSVWSSAVLQSQPYNYAWFAAAPDGLWAMKVVPEGEGKGHRAPQRIADIPNAFWVRGDQKRVYVATLNQAIYEYDVDTGTVTERRPSGSKQTFCFMAIDEAGTIGPQGNLYYGGTVPPSKTVIYRYDTDTWEMSYWSKFRAINRIVYGNWTALNDSLGHYMWGLGIHDELPLAVSNGICNAPGPFLWTGCLGDLPVPDAKISSAGISDFTYGLRNHHIGLSSIWGFAGHSMIGFSVEEFNALKTWEEAEPVIMERLEPLCHPAQTIEQRRDIARQLWVQRTRAHFYSTAQ